MIAASLPLSEIAASVGTPFYCYDAATLRSRFTLVRNALPEAELFYSLKANPNLSVVKVLVRAGAGCEVCSLAELEIAIAAGAAPESIIFLGPAKGRSEITRAIEVGTRAIVAESIAELSLIDEIAQLHGCQQPVAIRINPNFSTGSARLAMSGRATQFGIDGEDLRTALDHIARLRNISLHGLHIYMGTRILDHRAIVDNTMRILALADEISAQIASPLAFIDVGGGFGVPYFKGEPELDLDALSDEIAPEIARRRRAKAETRIAFELGRFLTAPAGVFVTRVRSTKRAKGRDFAVCDGGSNCHSAAAGYGSALRKNFPMSVIGKEQDRLSAWTITGPLCTPTDIVGQDVALPEIVCGDLICIHQSGAYGPSASPVHFLGFGHPAETMVDGDSITMIREADSLAHLLAAQVPRQISISPQTSSEPDKAKMREVLYVSA